MRVENAISQIQDISFNNTVAKKINTEKTTFDKFYDAALSLVSETNNLQVQADNSQLNFITGKTDDVLSVMMAQERAYGALNFTVQVTNKIVEAYREIMRFQV